MARLEDTLIKCPECGKDKDLSLHVSIRFASIRIPVVKGKPAPASELLLEKPIASDQVLLRFSDATGDTRLMIHDDEMEIWVNCPRCKKMIDLPKGTIKCSDVE